MDINIIYFFHQFLFYSAMLDFSNSVISWQSTGLFTKEFEPPKNVLANQLYHNNKNLAEQL